MTDYVEVRVSADIRVKCNETIRIPKSIWDDCPSDLLWGDAAEKYIKENITLEYPYFDESDVEVDDAQLLKSKGAA